MNPTQSPPNSHTTPSFHLTTHYPLPPNRQTPYPLLVHTHPTPKIYDPLSPTPPPPHGTVLSTYLYDKKYFDKQSIKDANFGQQFERLDQT